MKILRKKVNNLLIDAALEIERMHNLYGEVYKDKIGEPRLEIAQKIRQYLADNG